MFPLLINHENASGSLPQLWVSPMSDELSVVASSNGCFIFRCGPAINWWLVQVATIPSAKDMWQTSAPHMTLRTRGAPIENTWIHYTYRRKTAVNNLYFQWHHIRIRAAFCCRNIKKPAVCPPIGWWILTWHSGEDLWNICETKQAQPQWRGSLRAGALFE